MSKIRIKNRDELLQAHAGYASMKLCLGALEAALQSSDPAHLVRRSVRLRGSVLSVNDIYGKSVKLDIDSFSSIYVVGAGKATASMAGSLCTILGRRISGGAITVPYGAQVKTKGLQITEASHPLPDHNGVSGTQKIIRILKSTERNDLVFVLLSGGGSALLPLPAKGLSLSTKRTVTKLLLAAGASIGEINTVRKHLSAVKGGRLLNYVAKGCRVVSLVLSDVVGDDLGAIASGPTVPDPSTFKDAIAVMKKYKVTKVTQASRYLNLGATGGAKETPKPGDSIFETVSNMLIGNNYTACKGAIEFFKRHRVKTTYLGSEFNCRATTLGKRLADAVASCSRLAVSSALVMGGESTVNLASRKAKKVGIGGRNQEAILSCAVRMKARGNVTVACMGTDGVDGNSDAAGGIVTPRSIQLFAEKGINVKQFLARHDSYNALARANSLIFTGQTGTNVNDIAVLCYLP